MNPLYIIPAKQFPLLCLNISRNEELSVFQVYIWGKEPSFLKQSKKDSSILKKKEISKEEVWEENFWTRLHTLGTTEKYDPQCPDHPKVLGFV